LTILIKYLFYKIDNQLFNKYLPDVFALEKLGFYPQEPG